jgi:hypothetical protein
MPTAGRSPGETVVLGTEGSEARGLHVDGEAVVVRLRSETRDSEESGVEERQDREDAPVIVINCPGKAE